MAVDLHFFSVQLLERLANSIYERDPSQKQFCFSTKEVHVVESWLKDTAQEIIKDMAEY